jgi:hypothetical protein
MTTPDIRAALERLVELDGTSITMRSKQSSLAWSDAIAAVRAALAQPEGEGPSDADFYDLAKIFNGDPVPAMREALKLWGRPATPPAPEVGVGDVRELAGRLGWIAAQLGDIGWSDDSASVACAATLLQQQQHLLKLAGAELDRLVEQQAAPAPAVVPVAWCRSDEFANSMERGGSFNGWKDPGAGANKCDMQLYAIPLTAPQAGEEEA